jgi:hypothetical protein
MRARHNDKGNRRRSSDSHSRVDETSRKREKENKGGEDWSGAKKARAIQLQGQGRSGEGGKES